MCCRPAAPEDPRAGFTLLEVLVASSVAVILLVALLRAFGGVWDLNARVREEAEAMIIARAVLEAAGTRSGLAVRAQEGRAGAYQWGVNIEEAPVGVPPPLPDVVAARQRLEARASADENSDDEEDGANANAPAQWQLYRIRVAVVAPSGRRTFLESVKLGPVAR